MTSTSVLKVGKLVLFGDSISEMSSDQDLGFGLAPALQHEYLRRLQVITHGYGGYNTEHGRYLLEPVIDVETEGGRQIRLMSIFFGANDSNVAALTPFHVPLARYAENLDFLLSTAKARGIPVVVTGPTRLLNYDDRSEPARFNDFTQQYSAAARKAAQDHQVPFVDLESAFARETDPRSLYTDGVHFTGKGYKLWHKEFRQAIREHYPELRSENIPCHLPGIFDIDNNDLPASLWRTPVA